MVPVSFFVLVPLIFAFPEVLVNWRSALHDGVKIATTSDHEIVNQCLEAGLELRYRYELRICRRRTMWADACEETRVRLHSLQFDAMNETYRVSDDRLGDGEDATMTHVESKDEALALVTSIRDLAFTELGSSEEDLNSARAPYVGIRVIVKCQGEYSKTLAGISSFLTLGLVDLGTFSSGWADFRIREGR